jgi:transposase InsO family protein
VLQSICHLLDRSECSRPERQLAGRGLSPRRVTCALQGTPNGKAERFIGTMLGGWAYARPYRTSNQRTKALPKWVRYYNEQRPHRSLGNQSPAQRLRRAS